MAAPVKVVCSLNWQPRGFCQVFHRAFDMHVFVDSINSEKYVPKSGD